MNFSNSIGSLGVCLLLIGFFLNLFRIIDPGSRTYIFLNILGAGMSCYASVLIRYWPFVVLEGAWALVAIVALAGKKKRLGK
jgi:hypothetical protein